MRMKLVFVEELDQYARWKNVLKDLKPEKKVKVSKESPVVHGKWVQRKHNNPFSLYSCSVCGGMSWNFGYNGQRQIMREQQSRFCPNCGSMMDLKK